MTVILRTNVLSQFTCLGDTCPDTCCKNWSMQLDEVTHTRYQNEAPELLAAIEPAEETPWIMKKDPASGYCVKLEGGLCGIHKQYGPTFLGDACYFYPRSTRALGESRIMTATLSCPEIARLALFEDTPCAISKTEAGRLPTQIKNYLPDGISEADALFVHRAFLSACEEEGSAEMIHARIASVSRSLEHIDIKSWAQAAPFYLRSADARLPKPEMHPGDAFNILHALAGLMAAFRKAPTERLKETVDEMERMLAVTLDWQNVWIFTGDNSEAALAALTARWQESGEKKFAPVLKKYLQMQLSLALFPFGGFGGTLAERATIIGVRLATVKLALMCAYHIYGEAISQDTVVRVVQSISRFLDHLGDPSFSLQIYNETGWTKEARMRGLLSI